MSGSTSQRLAGRQRRTPVSKNVETRRILLDGYPTEVVRHGDVLVAGDGRQVAIADAIHLAPVELTKIIAVHLNYQSRTD